MKNKDKNLFRSIFSRYWDNVIIGIIAGLIVYYGVKVGYTLISGVFIFLSAFVLVLLYSLFTWSAIIYKWDKKSIEFLKQRWKLIGCMLIGFYVYLGIHELLHYYPARFFGYNPTICWLCLPTKVYLDMVNDHYFIIAIAPYILTTVILALLISVSLLIRKKYILLVSIPPFLDYFANILGMPIAYFTKTPNDFLNIIRLGFYWETLLMMTPPVIFVLLVKKIIYRKTETNDKNNKV